MVTKKQRDKMQKWFEDLQRNPLKHVKEMGHKFANRDFRQSIPLFYLSDPELWENNLNDVTMEEFIGKIRDFLHSKPKEMNYSTFLYYMAYFPVSMSKRVVSPKLKFLIGCHYGYFGVPTKEYEEYIQRVSMEELAEIFGRSKATIHDCIKTTKKEVQSFQEEVKRAIALDTKADRELIEERKAQLRKERALKSSSGEKTIE